MPFVEGFFGGLLDDRQSDSYRVSVTDIRAVCVSSTNGW